MKLDEGRNPCMFYHGTSLSRLPSILKHGLRGDWKSNYHDYSGMAPFKEGVYLTTRKAKAEFLGANAIKPGEKTDVIIIEILGDTKSMNVDEDDIIGKIADVVAIYRDSLRDRDEFISKIPNIIGILRYYDFKKANLKLKKNFFVVLEDMLKDEELIDFLKNYIEEDKDEFYMGFVKAASKIPKIKQYITKLMREAQMDDCRSPVSFVYPGNIGFRGSPRIVRIINAKTGEVLYPKTGGLFEKLKKVNGKWAIVSKKTGRPLRYYKGKKDKPSEKWIKQQEREIQYFKHLKEEQETEYAGILVRTKDGAYLLLRRAPEDHYGGMWNPPSGAIEKGETPEQGALREFYEEAGVDLRKMADTMYFIGETETPKGSRFHNFFIMVEDEFTPRLNREHDAWDWFEPDDLPPKTLEVVKEIIEKIERSLKKNEKT